MRQKEARRLPLERGKERIRLLLAGLGPNEEEDL